MHSSRSRALAVGALLVASSAGAAEAQPEPATIPYSGVLESAGVPVNASVDFNFALFTCPDPDVEEDDCADPLWVGAGTWQGGGPTWRDRWPASAVAITAPVFSGRFAVELGAPPMAPFPTELHLDAGELYLAIRVEGAALRDLQRLAPAFSALRSFEADDLRVRGDVEVLGNLTLDGDINALGGLSAGADVALEGNVTIGGDLVLDGTLRSQVLMERIVDREITSADDLVIDGLDGNADGRWVITLEGRFSGVTSNATIRIHPNNDRNTNNFGPGVQNWMISGPEPYDYTGLTGQASRSLAIGTTHFNTSCEISLRADFNAAAGMSRLVFSQDVVRHTTDNNLTGATSHANFWLNTTENITSLVFSFGGATDFDGHLVIYRAP